MSVSCLCQISVSHRKFKNRNSWEIIKLLCKMRFVHQEKPFQRQDILWMVLWDYVARVIWNSSSLLITRVRAIHWAFGFRKAPSYRFCLRFPWIETQQQWRSAEIPMVTFLLFAHAKVDSESIMTYYGIHVPSAQGWERESVPKSWTIFGSCSFKELRGKGAIKYVWYLTTGLFNLFCRRARFGKKCQGLLHNICIYSIVYIPFKICYLDVIKQWTFSV